MDYKLAKQLKDKGIPYLEKYEGLREVVFNPDLSGERILVPTLSELIDACVKIRGIRRIEWNEDNNEWLAVSQCKDEIIGASVGIGKTLEEAVVHLFIELNK